MPPLTIDSFRTPPREYGVMPFWFWNDDLDEQEIVRQIREFHAKGFGGFIPHARIGLSHRVGYLTNEWFRLVRIATEEAARLGMKVVLYDEGSYPSGSAAGLVARENPEYLARCVIPVETAVEGPVRGYWRPNPGRAMGDRLLAVVAGRLVNGDALDPDSLRVLEPGPHDVVPYDLPEGAWRLTSVWDVQTGGTIRGVFDEQEDGHALAPPATDLLNPDAVAAFIRLTHDAYYEHLRDHFGTTVVAMFTDEPSLSGRGPRRGPDPKQYTQGFIDEVAGAWGGDPVRWLPALWHECGERGAEFRRTWDRVAQDRLRRVFYGAQYDWCVRHGIALTGHPSGSNEMTALRLFHWPGQDMVWRYIEPDSPKALEGEHSVASKAATSAAALAGVRESAMESFGAYGWRLTLDEAKWLMDWHLVRGSSVYFLHALFYSIRGRRAFESEPDLGVHNFWWPYFGLIGDYARRMSYLLRNTDPVCEVAIVSDGDAMAWRAAKLLHQAQIDFLFVDEPALASAQIDGTELVVGNRRFRALISDPPENRIAGGLLDRFAASGGCVIDTWTGADLVDRLSAHVEPVVSFDGEGRADLRALRLTGDGIDCCFLVNEGEQPVTGTLRVAGESGAQVWDPVDGTAYPWPCEARDGMLTGNLRLERRQSLVLRIGVTADACADYDGPPPIPGGTLLPLDGDWQVETADGSVANIPCPGDWARETGWETFSGTLTYRCAFAYTGPSTAFIDLGRVGDIAEVTLNGTPLGVRAWVPYCVLTTELRERGMNELVVKVTNSMANEYDGLQMPSGLMGPVAIREAI